MKTLKVDKRLNWTVTYYEFYNDCKDINEIMIEFKNKHGGEYTGYCDKNDYELLKDKHLIAHKHGETMHMAYFYKDDKSKIHIQYVHRLLIDNITDGNQVDHINTNGLDNRRYNLRVVDPSTNVRNTRMRSDNTSGRKGIQIHRVPNTGEVYQIEACVRDFDKKRIRKTWYVPKFGYDNALKLASEWLDEMQPKYDIRISTESSKDVHKLR